MENPETPTGVQELAEEEVKENKFLKNNNALVKKEEIAVKEGRNGSLLYQISVA